MFKGRSVLSFRENDEWHLAKSTAKKNVVHYFQIFFATFNAIYRN